MTTELDKAFEEFQKLPDWHLYPMPDKFYKHFNLKKPKPAEVKEICWFQPPASEWFPTETKGPAEGGVREIPQLEAPPVSVEMLSIEAPPEPKPVEEKKMTEEEFKDLLVKDLPSLKILTKEGEYTASLNC